MTITQGKCGMVKNANAVELNLEWSFKSKEDFIKRKYLFEEVLYFDFNIDSFTYEKTIRNDEKYSGYDIGEDTVERLKNNDSYADFWSHEKENNLITLNNVYEHIDEATRESVIKRSYELLVEKGILMPFNIFALYPSPLTPWRYSNHVFPHPSPRMIVALTEFYGFRSTGFLVNLNCNPFGTQQLFKKISPTNDDSRMH